MTPRTWQALHAGLNPPSCVQSQYKWALWEEPDTYGDARMLVAGAEPADREAFGEPRIESPAYRVLNLAVESAEAC